MLVIVPAQIYRERRVAGAIEPGYFTFWRTVFALRPYPEGSLPLAPRE